MQSLHTKEILTCLDVSLKLTQTKYPCTEKIILGGMESFVLQPVNPAS